MQKDSRLCWLEKYQGIVCSIVFYFFIQPEDVFSGRDDALARGFFNIPVDTPGWISGDCHPQPLIPIGRFYLSGPGSFHPQLTMILSEGWHDEVNADMYRFVSRDKRE